MADICALEQGSGLTGFVDKTCFDCRGEKKNKTLTHLWKYSIRCRVCYVPFSFINKHCSITQCDINGKRKSKFFLLPSQNLFLKSCLVHTSHVKGSQIKRKPRHARNMYTLHKKCKYGMKNISDIKFRKSKICWLRFKHQENVKSRVTTGNVRLSLLLIAIC